MAARAIIVAFDVLKCLQLCFFEIPEAAAFEQLGFVARPEALGVRVVVGFSGAAHTLLPTVAREQLAKIGGRTLETRI